MDKNLYDKKIEHLSTYYEEVTSFEFYRDLFPVGSFERGGHYEDNKPNGIALGIDKDGSVHRYTVTDDLVELKRLTKHEFTIISPISYFGKQRTSRNARYLYALAFDIDGVGMPQLRDLLHQMKHDVIPTATYIINSGTGLHLYYFLDEPVPLYPQNQKYLKELKYALTKRLWNGYTSTIEQPQMQGIMQGFRVVGSNSKLGSDCPVRAFLISDHRFTIEELLEYIPNTMHERDRVQNILKKSKISLSKAKEMYPEWYDRRIVKGEKRGHWNIKRDLYDWWLKRIRSEITVGHRFYAIMTLAIYAKKCNIDEVELRKDAYSLFDVYEAKTESDNNHFTQEDIEKALELYNEEFVTFPRDDIGKLTGLPMSVNKRNKRKQDIHLRLARNQLALLKELGETTQGRPSAELTVKDFQKNNPLAKPKEIIQGTGLSKNTVYKYYKKNIIGDENEK